MIFHRHINKYYIKYLLFFILGVVALVLVDIVQTRIPHFLGQIIDENNVLIADNAQLGKIILRIVLCAVIIFFGRVTWRLTIFRASTGIEANLRLDMFKKAERLSANYYHDNKVGTVMAWFTNDVETVGEFFGWGTIMLIDAVFLSVIVIVQMVMVNLYITFIALIPIVLIIIWGALVERYMAYKWDERQQAYDELYDFTQENFTGIRVIKAFVKENKEIHAFAKVAQKNKDVNVSFARTQILFDILIEIIIALEMGCILGFGGWFVYAAATGIPVVLFDRAIDISIGQLMEFVGYVDLLIWPMIALGQIVTMRSRCKASLKRIGIFLDAPEDIKNAENAVKLGSITGKIEFRHFSFTYPGSESDSLKDISLTINPGEKIGIVGKIGCGKTTLANALLRIYNVEEGTLFIDDTDLMKVDITSLRDNIAYSPQDNFLFSDTISNNIGFASDELKQDEVVEAAVFADVHDNVMEFQDKYETISGERGVTLSGGQKQRLSIARAYYKKAPIMVLDDSVSAVDVKTEENILHNINEHRKGLTTIVVASRVSTVKDFDRIIVLNNGELEAFDSHENLLKTSKTYQRMVYLQTLETELDS